MPNTSKGTPYVQSSDLVSAYPTTSLSLANHIDNNLTYNALTYQSNTGTTYTFALADASLGKVVTASNAAAQTYTVPPQTSIAWATGAVIRLVNIGAGAVTIVGGAGVTVSNAVSTVGQWEGVSIMRTASDSWVVVRGGGLPKAVYSSATVAPANTFTSGSSTIYVWKANTVITFSQAGTCEILLVGGGAGGGITLGSGGGGGGGVLGVTTAYVGLTLNVTIGAGGAVGAGGSSSGGLGSTSRAGDYYAVGGGGGAGNNAAGVSLALVGGSGGGGSSAGATTAGATGITGQGNTGGNSGGGPNYAGGGGGGGGAVGAVGVNATSTGGAGGNGATSTILSAADASTAAVGQVSGGLVYYGGGGGGGGSTANGAAGLGGGGGTTVANGTANTGGGARAGGAGGSGVFILKVG